MGTSIGIQAFLGEFWALLQEMILPRWNGNDPYAGDAEPPRLICWRLTTTRVGGGHLAFFHAITSYPRSSYQGGCTPACIFKSYLVILSRRRHLLCKRSPYLFIYIYILHILKKSNHNFPCPGKHDRLSHINYLQWEMASGKSVIYST